MGMFQYECTCFNSVNEHMENILYSLVVRRRNRRRTGVSATNDPVVYDTKQKLDVSGVSELTQIESCRHIKAHNNGKFTKVKWSELKPNYKFFLNLSFYFTIPKRQK